MSTIVLADRAAALHRDALVWDNLFPAGPQCGSDEAHVRMLRRMVTSGYDFVSLTARGQRRVALNLACLPEQANRLRTRRERVHPPSSRTS